MLYWAEEMWAKRRTLLPVVGTIGLFVWLITVVQGVSGAFLHALETPFRSNDVQLTVQRAGAPPSRFDGVVLPGSHSSIAPEELEAVRTLSGVTMVTGAFYLWWVERSTLTGVLAVERLGDQEVAPGTALLVESTAVRLGLRLGDTVQVGGRSLRLAGLLPVGALLIGLATKPRNPACRTRPYRDERGNAHVCVAVATYP